MRENKKPKKLEKRKRNYRSKGKKKSLTKSNQIDWIFNSVQIVNFLKNSPSEFN